MTHKLNIPSGRWQLQVVGVVVAQNEVAVRRAPTKVETSATLFVL